MFFKVCWTAIIETINTPSLLLRAILDINALKFIFINYKQNIWCRYPPKSKITLLPTTGSSEQHFMAAESSINKNKQQELP